jgi:hypothetical protein
VAATATRVYSFTLDVATMAKIDAWHADPHNRASSRSEALRQMVDLADRRRSAVRQYTRRGRQTVQTSAQISGKLNATNT